MKDGNEPQNPDAKLKPAQQTGEQFGSVKHGQLGENNPADRSDMPRGSETESRNAAGRRG